MATTLRIELDKQLYELLVDSNALSADNHKLLLVEQSGHDYSNNEVWKAAKSKSDKAFKQLKEIEFKLRHNMPHGE